MSGFPEGGPADEVPARAAAGAGGSALRQQQQLQLQGQGQGQQVGQQEQGQGQGQHGQSPLQLEEEGGEGQDSVALIVPPELTQGQQGQLDVDVGVGPRTLLLRSSSGSEAENSDALGDAGSDESSGSLGLLPSQAQYLFVGEPASGASSGTEFASAGSNFTYVLGRGRAEGGGL